MDEQYSWPDQCEMQISTSADGERILSSNDRSLDLSDTLVPYVSDDSGSFIITFVANRTDKNWSTEEIAHVKSLIQYDLNFDGYAVELSHLGSDQSQQIRFKLNIDITT